MTSQPKASAVMEKIKRLAETKPTHMQNFRSDENGIATTVSTQPEGTHLPVRTEDLKEIAELCETMYHDCCVMREALENMKKGDPRINEISSKALSKVSKYSTPK